MKILALAPRPLWPEHDGGTVATARCLNGLADAGASVTLLSMRTEKYPSKEIPAEEHLPRHLAKYTEIPVNTRISTAALLHNLFLSDKPYDLMRFWSQEYTEALRSALRSEQFDLIHCEGLLFVLYLDEIRKFSEAPVVFRAHNLEHRIRQMTATRSVSPVRKVYLSNLSRRLMDLEIKAARQFDAIVTISEPDSQWFSSVAPGKRVFLSVTGAENMENINDPGDRHGSGHGIEANQGSGPEYEHENVSVDEPEAEPPADRLRVGFLGSMNWQPNIEGIKWFIKSVWPSVLKKIPCATLHVAGRGLGMAENLLPRGLNIINDGEPDNARRFLASNHVVISPLFAGSGIRIKIIDAMSTGRPVVATPVAVEGLMAQNGRELAVADDPDSFCACLVKYLLDPQLRYSTGKAALKLIRAEYDNRVLTSRLLEFYRKLAHGS